MIEVYSIDSSKLIGNSPEVSNFNPVIRENRQLVTNEPVEFENKPVEVQDCRKITDQFRGIYRIYPNLIKENQRMSTCNPVGLANTRISTGYAQKSPRSLLQPAKPQTQPVHLTTI